MNLGGGSAFLHPGANSGGRGEGRGGEGNGNGKWRVLGQEEIKNAKSEGWRPMTGAKNSTATGANRETGASGGNGASEGDDRDRIVEVKLDRDWDWGGEGELPRTPGWVPKLTPTRRGDELFLSVQ